MTLFPTSFTRPSTNVMVALTFASAPFVMFAPVPLRVIFGFETRLATKHEYLVSIRPFVPSRLVEICFYKKDLPIQAIDVLWFHNDATRRLYFPGLALEIAFGIVQGMVLGCDLWMSSTRQEKDDKYSLLLPTLCMFLYSGMCLSAFFVHCLKDDLKIASPTLFLQCCQVADTWCTCCTYVLMLEFSRERHSRMGGKQENKQMVSTVMAVILLLTTVGVALQQVWLVFLLHVVLQPMVGIPILCLESKQQGFYWLCGAALLIIYLVGGGAALAIPLTVATNYTFDALTSIFVGCRCGLVCYWAFVKQQANDFEDNSNQQEQEMDPKFKIKHD